MEKLTVKEDLCIGCGACVAIDPTHFDFNDEGLSSVISNENINTPEVQNAISSCPVNAIKLEQCNCNGECHHCENCEEN